MHPLYQKYNSRRPLTWRFDRVTELLEARPKPKPADPRYDDRYVTLARRFLGRLLATSDPELQGELFPKNPGLYYAYELHQDVDQERAKFVQACILARMSDEEAAARCGELPATIDWYEAMFFNVRDRLDSPYWIVKNCLGPAAERFLDDHGKQFTTKMFGYFVGPHMLDAWITTFNPNVDWKSMNDFDEVKDMHAAGTIRRRCVTHLQTAEINRYNITEFAGLHLRLMEMAKAAKTGEEARTIIETNIAVMLEKLPWDVGRPDPDALGPGSARRYDGMSAELRASDMMALGVGKDVVIPEEIKNLRIPEPRPADEIAQQGS